VERSAIPAMTRRKPMSSKQTGNVGKGVERADLSGAPGMEVITSVREWKKGEFFRRHRHHGIDVAYVIQGSMIQVPGEAPVMLETGTPAINLRDVTHAGFEIVGDQPLKIFSVHIVDKGKPLYEWEE
jgi:ChrR-like protein with cupin domain